MPERRRRRERAGRRRAGTGPRPASALLAWLAVAWSAGAGAAQQRIDADALPPGLAEEVVAAFNDPATVRISAPVRVAPGSVIVGDVGVLGGPVTLAGEIRGGLIVVNGDVVFEGGGRVAGDLLVLGGEVRGEAPASVEGTVVVYAEGLAYVRRGDRIELEAPRPRRRPLGTDFGPGNSHFTIRAGTSYNRVEGLPVMFGPIVQTRGENPFRVEALGVWRTESGFSLDDEELGYRLRAEQGFGASNGLALGLTVHSEVRPIEDGGLSDLEASMATFLFHQDHRDHLDREGWSVYARGEIPSRRVEATLEYLDEKHGFAPVGSPWTLTKNDEPWRPQPLVGSGDLRTLAATLLHDGRNDPGDPTDGWYARARVERGLSGDLRLPSFGTGADPVPDARVPVPSNFTTGTLDLRRHLRVSPDTDLALRLVAGGALSATPPPPQLQQALGGEGTLPGYRLFHLDCGARDRTFQAPRERVGADQPAMEPVFAAYGCDRTFLFQAQYRGHLFLDLDFLSGDEEWGEGWDWYPAVDLSPTWVVFVDAGRGWVAESPRWSVPGIERRDSGTLVDAGVGLFLGDLGLMWAFPFQGEDRGVNFHVRLSRRF